MQDVQDFSLNKKEILLLKNNLFKFFLKELGKIPEKITFRILVCFFKQIRPLGDSAFLVINRFYAIKVGHIFQWKVLRIEKVMILILASIKEQEEEQEEEEEEEEEEEKIIINAKKNIIELTPKERTTA